MISTHFTKGKTIYITTVGFHYKRSTAKKEYFLKGKYLHLERKIISSKNVENE